MNKLKSLTSLVDASDLRTDIDASLHELVRCIAPYGPCNGPFLLQNNCFGSRAMLHSAK